MTPIYALYEFAYWIWQGLTFALCIWVLIRTLRIPAAHAAGPICGVCAYQVDNTASDRCPECGTPIRRAGIITPHISASTRGSTFVAILAWTVLSMSIFWLLVWLMQSVMGMWEDSATLILLAGTALWYVCGLAFVIGRRRQVRETALTRTAAGRENLPIDAQTDR